MRKTLMCSVLVMLTCVFTTHIYAAATWASNDVAPAEWAALSNNLLANQTGTISGAIASGYSTNDPNLLTDGVVQTDTTLSQTEANRYRVGFQNNSSIAWTFAAPKTLNEVRVSAYYSNGTTYTKVAIENVYVKYVNSDTWESLGASFSDTAGRSSHVIICASLSDSTVGYLAEHIVGLKVAFGNTGALASYCVEIEAVGSSEATGPIIGSFDIAPAKTRAMISGSLADVGTDASECEVYLAINGGASTKIVGGVTNDFDYTLNDLTVGTTYTYELVVSNNAPTAMSTMRNGTFTTLDADAKTASWSQSEYSPEAWSTLSNNILAGLVPTNMTGVSVYASQDASKLTDGSIPSPAVGNETVGFISNGTVTWEFDEPVAIKKIRISSLWESTAYNGISVNAIHVQYRGVYEWEPLDVPTVEWTGGSQLCQTETLSDVETDYLARNVVCLKITFGAQKAAVANYYAEIEAVGHEEPKRGVVLFVH